MLFVIHPVHVKVDFNLLVIMAFPVELAEKS